MDSLDPAVVAVLQSVGTLANGSVYVAATKLDDTGSTFVTLGLFAGKVFRVKEPVVLYGGTLTGKKRGVLVGKGESDRSHGRYIPLCRPWLLSGRLWSDAIWAGVMNRTWLCQQASLDIECRTHIYPHDLKANDVTTVPADIISLSGTGFMVNTSPFASKFNVVLHTQRIHPRKGFGTWQFNANLPLVLYVATRRIEKNDQLFVNYGTCWEADIEPSSV
jgi:hypothetical protein